MHQAPWMGAERWQQGCGDAVPSAASAAPIYSFHLLPGSFGARFRLKLELSCVCNEWHWLQMFMTLLNSEATSIAACSSCIGQPSSVSLTGVFVKGWWLQWRAYVSCKHNCWYIKLSQLSIHRDTHNMRLIVVAMSKSSTVMVIKQYPFESFV